MLDLKYPVYYPVEKIPVVGHYDHTAPVGRKILLQPFEHAYIQMVGRFVKDEQIRFFQQQSSKSQSGTLSS